MWRRKGSFFLRVPGVDVIGQVVNKLWTAKVLADTGIIRPTRPDKLLRIGLALQRWGPTPAAGYIGAAIRFPNETAIIDELGTLTFEEVHRRTNALAHALADAGITEGDGVAIMCRNHRGFIDATVACSKLGAHALYLNTAFAGPQITDVVAREKPAALIYDSEFEELTHEAGKRRKRFIAWHDIDPENPKQPKDP
ncbi:MAG: AMP-dependent synthetase and ligase, partial [Solirubrobacteraceae bacterium]|nr:AMP-dependent synthetase and ligase [Solirubrobacteraceae bacterium]